MAIAEQRLPSELFTLHAPLLFRAYAWLFVSVLVGRSVVRVAADPTQSSETTTRQPTLGPPKTATRQADKGTARGGQSEDWCGWFGSGLCCCVVAFV